MPAPASLTLDEAAARRLVLAQAVQEEDTRGVLLGEAEVQQAEQALLRERALQPGERPDPAWYLPARADALLAIATRRQPALQRIAQPSLLWRRAMWVLPLLALVAGFASDRIGNPHELDLLSLPLLGFVAWNLAVYLLLLLAALLPRRRAPAHWPDRVLRAVADGPAWLRGRDATRLRHAVAARMQVLWWQVAGALEGARVRRALHWSAAAWALGIVLSILWVGVAREYRVGWESTWLSAPQVQRIVEAVSLPGRVVFRQPEVTLEEVQRLHLAAGHGRQAGDAARWAVLYLAFLFATVVIPRALLALWAGWRAARHERGLRIPLAQPHLQQVMARVSPAHVQLRLLAGEPWLEEVLRCVLRQAGVSGPNALRSLREDELRIARDADGDADADLLLCAVQHEDEITALAPQAGSTPVLLLCAPGLATERARRVAGTSGYVLGDVLALDACAACWPLDAQLRDAVQRLVPAWKQPGTERLMQAWARHHEALRASAVQALSQVLADAAREEQKLESRWPNARARDEAMTALLERLQRRLGELHLGLLRLYAVDGFLPGHALALNDTPLARMLTEGNVGAGGALAGAAAGALAGAKVDLLSGGLTMGGGAALGALLGGAGAFSAARWLNLGGAVRLGDEQLRQIAESLLMQYLAVIHTGRIAQPVHGEVPPQWQREVAHAMAAQQDAWKQALRAAREAAGAEPAALALAPVTGRTLDAALGNLYPAQA